MCSTPDCPVCFIAGQAVRQLGRGEGCRVAFNCGWAASERLLLLVNVGADLGIDFSQISAEVLVVSSGKGMILGKTFSIFKIK